MNDTTNPYERLANAIVLQAVKDYRAAKKKLKRKGRNIQAERDVADIERFFRSGWFSQLTEVDGEYLLDRLKREVDE